MSNNQDDLKTCIQIAMINELKVSRYSGTKRSNIRFADLTWEESFKKTWHEKREGNVSKEKSQTPYNHGIQWEIEDIDLTKDKLKYSPTRVYINEYPNKTETPIDIVKEFSKLVSIANSKTIEFNEKISAGSKTTVSAKVKCPVAEASVSEELSFGVELGSSQVFSYTKTETIEVSDTIKFTVPPNKTYKLECLFDEGKGNFPFKATFFAGGNAFYLWNDSKDGCSGHVYVHCLKNQPSNTRKFKVDGNFSGVDYLNGKVIITDITEKNHKEIAIKNINIKK